MFNVYLRISKLRESQLKPQFLIYLELWFSTSLSFGQRKTPHLTPLRLLRRIYLDEKVFLSLEARFEIRAYLYELVSISYNGEVIFHSLLSLFSIWSILKGLVERFPQHPWVFLTLDFPFNNLVYEQFLRR